MGSPSPDEVHQWKGVPEMRMTPAVLRSKVVYMSMEVGIDSAMPTYSGGLGVLAGDTLRSAADLHAPMVGISLLHRKGYFQQHLDDHGQQTESTVDWDPTQFLEPMSLRVAVTIEGRDVHIRPWTYLLQGVTGHSIPIYFLDTDLPENSDWDRTLTHYLYGGDHHYRLCQETVLGLGGVALMEELVRGRELLYHMNEGHSALLALALLERDLGDRGPESLSETDIETVRRHCVFTTHTPVPAGHDVFPMDLVRSVLGEDRTRLLEGTGCTDSGSLNMTSLALFFSRFTNGVAMQHGQTSRDMFPSFPISAITNAVHAMTWTSPPFQELFDLHMAQWRRDNLYLRYARGIPIQEIRDAHVSAKRALLAEVEKRTGVVMQEDVLTIGYARRATPYKRAPLLFSDLERLRHISRHVGRLQVLYAGKAHPHDVPGKDMIQEIFRAAGSLGEDATVVYLENYDAELARQLVSGVDVWLNTPIRPLEASGTSGMKAALNGVPSLSILDGWWVEGHLEGVTGWSIGNGHDSPADVDTETDSLYHKLEHVIVPLYYQEPDGYAEVMRSTIALNGSFFNTQRMVLQYLSNAYFPSERSESSPAVAPT